jgi:hypothetical protein
MNALLFINFHILFINKFGSLFLSMIATSTKSQNWRKKKTLIKSEQK